jgi:hypothetical protein
MGTLPKGTPCKAGIGTKSGPPAAGCPFGERPLLLVRVPFFVKEDYEAKRLKKVTGSEFLNSVPVTF